MSEKDQKLIKDINDIFMRGNSVEIKKDKGGNYVIYEVVIKNQCSCTDDRQILSYVAMDNRTVGVEMDVVEQREKQIKLAEIRAVLAEKAGAGYMAEVKALLRVVLCQEKVQVKSELFLQPSIFYPANLSILFNFCSYTFSYSFGDRYPQ